jgi:hypothetical protein
MSWRPADASDPDDDEEWRYGPLESIDRSLADRLISLFASSWLPAAGLPMSRLAEVPDTLELLAAPSWDPPDGSMILRLRSWYTGHTYWLHDWNGDHGAAEEWIREVAEENAFSVNFQRRDEPTIWDE